MLLGKISMVDLINDGASSRNLITQFNDIIRKSTSLPDSSCNDKNLADVMCADGRSQTRTSDRGGHDRQGRLTGDNNSVHYPPHPTDKYY
ncbi:unnamed protein product [Caenorhabditis bovis]|uniref:Uncharacterized protein n=1 Tax=Caenorhabditis bovis TaxID=2654633 RepID=A0A8S1ET21_9PELO|nr:unnamed protein product [Caenorhabditis bovis]